MCNCTICLRNSKPFAMALGKGMSGWERRLEGWGDHTALNGTASYLLGNKSHRSFF